MVINDKIYRRSKIDDSVAIEIIKSPSFQRLKKINQAGYFLPHFPQAKMNRFDHSVGVYLLLKKFGASAEEQISGLLHDVSHAVFSHCIDYVLPGGSGQRQDHQDKFLKTFIYQSELPNILKKYKYNLNRLLADKNFPLKEKDLPDLCADRIDYALRDAFTLGEIQPVAVKYFLNNLIVEKNRWLFKNITAAKRFARLYQRLNRHYYSGRSSALMFKTVGDCLKYALAKEYLTFKDLYSTDQEVITKLKKISCRDSHLKLLFDRMNNKIKATHLSGEGADLISCKSRIVDPLFLANNRIKRLSQIDNSWKAVVKKESKTKVHCVRFAD